MMLTVLAGRDILGTVDGAPVVFTSVATGWPLEAATCCVMICVGVICKRIVYMTSYMIIY